MKLLAHSLRKHSTHRHHNRRHASIAACSVQWDRFCILQPAQRAGKPISKFTASHCLLWLMHVVCYNERNPATGNIKIPCFLRSHKLTVVATGRSREETTVWYRIFNGKVPSGLAVLFTGQSWQHSCRSQARKFYDRCFTVWPPWFSWTRWTAEINYTKYAHQWGTCRLQWSEEPQPKSSY